MAVLERRVQVLFHPERYKQLEALAHAEGKSVGAIVRDSVEERLARTQASKRAALARLLSAADGEDPELADWNAVKESFERDHLGGIG
jgi:hypothetical protein